METEMICSDLLALTKLYALLGRAGDGETPELQDEKARLLLKNLLDGAAERVLQNHSEIIASKLGVSDAKCCSQVATSNSVPPPSPNISKRTHGVPQITRKDSKSGVPQITRKDSNRRADAVFKRNVSSTNLENIGSCRACEWSGLGQINLAEDTVSFSSHHKAWNLHNQEQENLPSLSWQQRIQTTKEPDIDDWLLNQTHSPILGGFTRQNSASRSILRSNDRSSRQLARRPRSPNQSMSRASSPPWTNKNHVHSNNVKDDYVKVVKPRAPVPPRSVTSMASKGHAHKLTRNRPRDKDPGQRRIITPTLLDHHHKSGQVYSEESSRERSWDDDSKSSQSSQREILPYEQEYEETASASLGSYTSLTSQQTSSSNGESEAYSSPTWTSQQSSDSYGESEALSSPKNHRQAGQIPKPKARIRGDRSSCNGNVSPKMKRSNQQGKQEKGKGGLRKVKHMFGLILQPFHNHGGKDHRDQKEHTKEGGSKSNWKREQKVINSPTKKVEVGQSRAIQVRKSEGAKGTGKNQAGQFLGMLVHVKKAKTPKPPKGIGSGEIVKPLANKKMNGWQRLHHHTKVKLPNKRKPLTRKITLLDHQR